MMNREITVGDIVRLKGTRYAAIVVSKADEQGRVHVVEVDDMLEYHGLSNFIGDRWPLVEIELLIPREEVVDFPVWKGEV